MTKERLHILIDRYLSELLTKEEQAELYSAVNEPETEAQTKELILEQFENKAFNYHPDLNNLFTRIIAETKETAPVHRVHFLRSGFRKIAAAAAVIGVITLSYFLIQRDQSVKDLSQAERFKNDITPGRTGAVLTLDNGQTVLLDTANKGSVLGHFSKGDSSLTVATSTVQYATLTTPVGRTEILHLQDGTTVYLNAGSSIRFPTVFTGRERLVEITGEAFFEVAHNAKQPFKVKAGEDVIEDIGTSFNVNSYAQEKGIATTLVEGIVKINQKILKPGEQYKNGQVRTVDVDPVIAWKNGLFRYDGASIETIMSQVAVWYGAQIIYKEKVLEEFVARIPRDVPVSKLLELLEATGHVRFMIEGKTITVMK